MPGPKPRDVSSGMRRFLVLSIPYPGLLAQAVPGRAGSAEAGLQDSRRDYRRGVPGAPAIRRSSGLAEPQFPGRARLESRVPRFTRALSRTDCRLDLRVRLVFKGRLLTTRPAL